MDRRRFLHVGAAAPLLSWACSKPAPDTRAASAPRLMAQDRQQVAVVNSDGSVDWSWPNGTNAHDLHLLANGNVLVPTSHDALAEVSPEKESVWEWKSSPTSAEVDKVEIHGFERLDSGLTMIAETGNKRIIEVDREGMVQHEIKLQVDNPDSHRDTRLVRSTPDGTYLVAHEKDGAVREYAADGKVVWEYKLELNGEPTPTHRGHGTSVYSAYRLPSGNTLIGGGNNNRVLEVNPGGEIVWSLESNEIPGIQLFWITQLHALANGNVVVTNTHAEGETPQIFEVTRDKELVWGFLDWETFGNDLCANILLDSQEKFVR